MLSKLILMNRYFTVYYGFCNLKLLNQRRSEVKTFVFWISGSSINLHFIQTYGLILFLFDILWWSYLAGIILIEGSSICSKIKSSTIKITVCKGLRKDSQPQGCNTRKVISEVYAFFVLQCTVFGRKSKHKTDVTAWNGILFYKNNLWNILVIGNYYVNNQN